MIKYNILEWLHYINPFKVKNKFDPKKYPVNTVLDYKYLEININNKNLLKQTLDSIEKFYFNHESYITVRQGDYSIVIVNPFLIDKEDKLHIAFMDGLSGSVFIGKKGEDINFFKEEVNKKIQVRNNLEKINKVKMVSLHKITNL